MQWGKVRTHLRERAAQVHDEYQAHVGERDLALSLYTHSRLLNDLANAIEAGLPVVKFVPKDGSITVKAKGDVEVTSSSKILLTEKEDVE